MDLTAREYLRAQRIRSLMQDAFRSVFVDIDMILAPSRTGVAPRISDPIDGGASRNPPNPAAIADRIVPAGNLFGLPALSLPAGFEGNLPEGISIVGRPWTENQLIGLGRACQSQTDWHRRRPPVATPVYPRREGYKLR